MSDLQLDKVRAQRIRELEVKLGFPVVALQPETQLARLSKEQTVHLNFVEKELGMTLVAYDSSDRLRLASPESTKLRKIQELEKQLGYVLMAYELNQAKSRVQNFSTEMAVPSAELSEKQFKQLQEVEKEVGLTLMAYKPIKNEKKK